jgi:predicted ATPase
MRNTHWQVITGAPCSGKTAVVRELGNRGFRVVHEAARAFIDGELRKGKTLKVIKADPLAFERQILMEKIGIEKALPGDVTIFLDRAVPDSIAYFVAEGLDPAEPESQSRRIRYRNVFLLDRLTFENDRVRTENDRLAERLEVLLERAYRDLGYEITRIPVLPVPERVAMILRVVHTESRSGISDVG